MIRNFVLLFALLFPVAAFSLGGGGSRGGNSGGNSGENEVSCKNDGDCYVGLRCDSKTNTCTLSCSDFDKCPTGYQCRFGRCTSKRSPGGGSCSKSGESCYRNAHCCAGHCDLRQDKCVGGGGCLQNGAECQTGFDCCSRNCERPFGGFSRICKSW